MRPTLIVGGILDNSSPGRTIKILLPLRSRNGRNWYSLWRGEKREGWMEGKKEEI